MYPPIAELFQITPEEVRLMLEETKRQATDAATPAEK
jgi:hypothetical protein